MRRVRALALAWICSAIVAACAPNSMPPAQSGAPAASQAGRSATEPAAPRTLNIMVRGEAPSLAVKPLGGSPGYSVVSTTRPFNATLDILDAREVARPYLADELPKLNTDSWRVFPDGRMETTYRLKPDLFWHDGTALAAADFVFAWQVYAHPTFGQAGGPPLHMLDEVTAPDARSLVFRWRQPYPDAGAHNLNFQALPRHILAQPFQQSDPEAFTNHPYWSREFVGLGPYQLQRWEPGAFIEGVAFDRHVGGRPKIDRIHVRFTNDENAVLANLLSDTVHLATDLALRYEGASELKRQWGPQGKGTALLAPAQTRYTWFQSRPEYADPAGLLDIRVRRAIAHATDRQSLNDGLFDGEGVSTHTLLRHTVPYYADVDRAITKYLYDPRQAEQLLLQAGYRRGADGLFVNPAGQPLAPQLINASGAINERQSLLLADGMRKAGIGTTLEHWSPARGRDLEYRATFPGIQSTAGSGGWEDTYYFLTSAEVGTAQNRWVGRNRGGWTNQEYDRLWDAYSTTLDTPERNRIFVQIEKLISEQLPLIPLNFNFEVAAWAGALTGPDAQSVTPELLVWNIQEWELR